MVFDELFLDREERDRINIYSTLWEAPGTGWILLPPP